MYPDPRQKYTDTLIQSKSTEKLILGMITQVFCPDAGVHRYSGQRRWSTETMIRESIAQLVRSDGGVHRYFDPR